MKKTILLSVILSATFIACTTDEQETNFDYRQEKSSDTFIMPNIGDTVIVDVEVRPKVYESKPITIICREFTGNGQWKGVGKDSEGFYYDVESRLETQIINGVISQKQVITAKLSKLQFPWSPNC